MPYSLGTNNKNKTQKRNKTGVIIMECPKCKIAMKKRILQEVEVDECEKCEGIWLDKDELRQLKDKTDSDLNGWISKFGTIKTNLKLKQKIMLARIVVVQ